MCTVHDDVCVFVIIPRRIFLRMGNIQTRLQRKSKHTFCVQYFFLNRAFYEIVLKNMVQPERPQETTQYGAFTLCAG